MSITRCAVILLALTLPMTAAPVSIPLEVTARGRVFVPLNVHGSRTLWFMLDTAAPTSADPSIVAELKLHTESVPDVTLTIGSYSLHVPLFGTPVKQLEPALGHTIDGILGAELFATGVIQLDYEHHMLVIGAKRPRNAVALPLMMRHRFPHTTATLDFGSGPVTGTFLIDTGADTTFDIYKPFADAHSIAPPETTARSVTIGRVTLNDIRVYLPRDTAGLPAVNDVAGLLGTVFLKRFNVTFDARAKLMYLQSYPQSAAAGPDDCYARQQCQSKPANGVVLSAQETCWVRILGARCNLRDACIVKCLLSGEGRQNAGGCWHLCTNVFVQSGGTLQACPYDPLPELAQCDSAVQ